MWNPFRKKEEIKFPNKFALVRYSEHAKNKGLFFNETAIVEIYKEGKLTGIPMPYSEELVNSLEEIDEIPVVWEKFKEEPYEFEDTTEFGFTEYRG